MSDVATKDDIRAAMSAWEEFKTTNDSRLAQLEGKAGAADPITVAKLDKIEQTLASYEGLNQKITTAEAQAEKAAKLADALEVKFNRFGIGGNGGPSMDRVERRAQVMVKASKWALAVDRCVKLGMANLTEDEIKLIQDVKAEYKALNVTDDTGGGYLAPVEFVAEILKTVVLISPVRALARIRTTANKSMKIPRRVGLLAAAWEGETDTAAPATGLKYGLIEVFTKKLRAMVDISNDMLEDAAFDMGAEILAEVSEQYAVSEGAAFVNGSGALQPEGFLVNKDVIAAGNVTKTANATQLTADSIITCYHALKTAYARNAVWAANRQTIGAVRQLKDSVGQYLFMMGLPNGAPNTILGSPYVEVPDMPAVAAGAYPMAFGDFNRGYSLVDRVEMTMLRDPYSQADEDEVRYRFRKRLGGQTTMAEAIQPLLVST